MSQIKSSQITWDSGKEPDGGLLYIEQFSGMVRTMEHGPPLEEFIDEKTERNINQKTIVPSMFSSDPDFDLPDGVEHSTTTSMTSDDQVGTMVSDDETVRPLRVLPKRGGFQLKPALIPYRDLTYERIPQAGPSTVLSVRVWHQGSKEDIAIMRHA